MRILPAVLAAAFLSFATPTLTVAQEGSTLADEQMLIKQLNTDKRAVYAQNLQLTDSQSGEFWKIYDEYERETKKLDDRFLNLLNDYAANYETLTDAQATTMLKEKMAIEKSRMALKQKYTAKVAKVLPAKQALRYAQIETRVESLVRRNVYSIIPLAR